MPEAATPEFDPYALVSSPEFMKAVEAMSAHEKLHPRAPLDALLLVACEYLPLTFEEDGAAAKPTGYPAGVEWQRPHPDDGEADAFIAESETFIEALWAVADKYEIPLTNNEPRWQDGQYLREVGEFIHDVKEVVTRFPQEPQADITP